MTCKFWFSVLLLLAAGSLGATSFPVAPAITDSLVGMGMEDVRAKEADGILCIAYEDNVYRGTCRGLGAVIGMLLNDEKIQAAVHIVVLEACVPQISVHISGEAIARYRRNEWSREQLVGSLQISYDTDEDMRRLGGVRAANRSRQCLVRQALRGNRQPLARHRGRALERSFFYGTGHFPGLE